MDERPARPRYCCPELQPRPVDNYLGKIFARPYDTSRTILDMVQPSGYWLPLRGPQVPVPSAIPTDPDTLAPAYVPYRLSCNAAQVGRDTR